jgi:hypothetical protein
MRFKSIALMLSLSSTALAQNPEEPWTPLNRYQALELLANSIPSQRVAALVEE